MLGVGFCFFLEILRILLSIRNVPALLPILHHSFSEQEPFLELNSNTLIYQKQLQDGWQRSVDKRSFIRERSLENSRAVNHLFGLFGSGLTKFAPTHECLRHRSSTRHKHDMSPANQPSYRPAMDSKRLHCAYEATGSKGFVVCVARPLHVKDCPFRAPILELVRFMPALKTPDRSAMEWITLNSGLFLSAMSSGIRRTTSPH